ncbi:MAG: sigma-70 family RNA polymerase sigma factor [Terracidiphilus sp.]
MNENPPNPTAAVNRSVDGVLGEQEPGRVAPTGDQRLLDRVQAGDQQAMTDIFDQYGRMVYSVALRVLGDPGHAEDVMQEVLFKVWREPSTFLAGRGSLGAWLAVMTRNKAIDALRRRKPTDPVEDVVLISATNLASEVERNSTIERVRRVLKGLPAEQQMSMELAYFEGLSHSEIASRTGDPLGTVKTRIRTALTSLRKALEA